MSPGTRACIAYVAGRTISGRSGSSVYDYSRSRHISISGAVSGANVAVYDHDRACHFSGQLPNLYDYGVSAHVSLQINRNHFAGYDYGTGHHFSGSVNGGSVTLYDYGESQHFSYSL